MQKLTSHLWFDKEAKEAAIFYTSVFKDAEITESIELHNTPSGDVDVINLRIFDHAFTLISAGPLFKFNPSISFMVACESAEEVNELWAKLADGGKALMEIGEYPFSKRYGWIADKYGLSWQLAYMEGREIKQKITPALMFVGDKAGKAEEAMNFYTSLFPNSSVDFLMRYEEGESKDDVGTIKHGSFTLNGQIFVAMDSALEHNFDFNEAVSIVVNCDDQKEIDFFWEKLSADPSAEQCGWLKDKFGVSWQIVPVGMNDIYKSGDQAKIDRVTEAFLKMKKFDIAELEKAAQGQ